MVHNNVHYVPIEMFSGLSGIKITNSYMQSFYITNESNNSYISFDVEKKCRVTVVGQSTGDDERELRLVSSADTKTAVATFVAIGIV